MIVVASSLNMRFYKHHGWTEEILRACALKPENKIRYWSDVESPYWIADSWNCFDLEKLKEHVTEFHTFEREVVKDRDRIMFYLEDNN